MKYSRNFTRTFGWLMRQARCVDNLANLPWLLNRSPLKCLVMVMSWLAALERRRNQAGSLVILPPAWAEVVSCIHACINAMDAVAVPCRVV